MDHVAANPIARIEPASHRSTTAILHDGARVLIRPLCQNDSDRLSSYFRDLTSTIAYQRFHGFCHRPSAAALRRMTNPNFSSHVGLIALLRAPGESENRIVAEGLYLADSGSGVAELGLSVAGAYQRLGIGSLLLESLREWARSAGLARIEAEVLASNHCASRFLSYRGFRSGGYPEGGVCRFFLPLGSPIGDRSAANDM